MAAERRCRSTKFIGGQGSSALSRPMREESACSKNYSAKDSGPVP